MKRKNKKNSGKNEILVCGHSHFAEFDLQNQFINIGSIEDGLAKYLLIDEGKTQPKEEWYDLPAGRQASSILI